MVAYSNLKAEMARYGISNIKVAAEINVTERTLRNKKVSRLFSLSAQASKKLDIMQSERKITVSAIVEELIMNS